MYNRLVTNSRRRSYRLDYNTDYPKVRYSGRSTAIALEAVAKATRNPQEWIPVVDHYPQATQIQHVDLAKKAIEIADKMFLMYFERDRNMIRSCGMTNNQLELK